MAVFVNLVTLINEPTGGYIIPPLGQPLVVAVDQSPNAFTVGSCVVIADPSNPPLSQPYVGQV
jgi:hypothetical protein